MKQFKRTRGRLPGSVGGKEVRLCDWLHNNTDTASNQHLLPLPRARQEAGPPRRQLAVHASPSRLMKQARRACSRSIETWEFFLTLFSLNSGSFAATIYLLTIRSVPAVDWTPVDQDAGVET